MSGKKIIVRGAREHNLQRINLEIPRNQFVVFTGVSGSGKSSLAFDTLYAEGQRRYVESLSAYARQFLEQMEKPKVDYIGGLSPAIAIEQKSAAKNPRSTVGTVTEIYDYLRVLYARVGQPHCPHCGRKIGAQSAPQMVQQVLQLGPGTRFEVLAPLVQQRKGEYRDLLQQLRSDGFSRVRLDGEVRDLDQPIRLNKKVKHNIEVVVDRLVLPNAPQDAFRSRLTDSVETALRLAEGRLLIAPEEGEEFLLSETNACVECGFSMPELSPQLFSFNSPQGACPRCSGLGTVMEVDPELIVGDPSLSLHDGAIRYWRKMGERRDSWTYRCLNSIAQCYDFDLDTPWQDLPPEQRQVVLYGSGEELVNFSWESERGQGQFQRPWEGLVHEISRRYRQTHSEGSRRWYASFMSRLPCPECGGAKLRPEALAVTVGERSIQGVTSFSIDQALDWVERLQGRRPTAAQADRTEAESQPLTDYQLQIAQEVLKEIAERLGFLVSVGLDYLTLDRAAPTLSGGESQRIRLASQIGSGLVGVMYILDEPTIGLHVRDNRRLLHTLFRLRDLGNTVIVVEHDLETIRSADWIVDFGPGAGQQGGRIVAAGAPAELEGGDSLTGQYLAGRLEISIPAQRRRPGQEWLELEGARLNNLKDVMARFPLGTLICVTGVSGSGKSSLLIETLHPLLAQRLHRARAKAGPYRALRGLEYVDKVIEIDQQPIGRTPRSNPATYVKLFDEVRNLFARTPEAKIRGYKPGRFSFNVKGGRCEACQGHGQVKIEMHFLPDVWVTCQVCKGKRYNRETLQVRYRGKTIADILDMEVQEALDFFEAHPRIVRILDTLRDVGMGYIQLGQPSPTLSGGEAQRIKLARELHRVATGRTVYILDEPTTGLHLADVQKLLQVLHRLVEAGNTVIVIEHNLDVIKTADWLLDMGPEGGDQGGYIVAEGPPEAVAAVEGSYTGSFLARLLG
ncbi:MAG: excinuclease ABC subunit UvrA [Chloroflexia bacterium]|nr:excinuclease ABC subunit UvrA [Chloroflexia bacterium]